MGNQQGSLSFDVGWLIGFLDGEGSIMLLKDAPSQKLKSDRWRPKICVDNTDFATIERAANVLDTLAVPYHVSDVNMQKQNPKWKNAKRIEISGMKRCLNFLSKVGWFLTGDKLEKAHLVREFCESRLSKWMQEPYDDREIEIVRLVTGYDKPLRGHTPD